jgi:hypothetical protein
MGKALATYPKRERIGFRRSGRWVRVIYRADPAAAPEVMGVGPWRLNAAARA